MLIQFYQCYMCGSVMVEDDGARRSGDFECTCPFCDEGKDQEVRKLEITDRNKEQYTKALRHLVHSLWKLGVRL